MLALSNETDFLGGHSIDRGQAPFIEFTHRLLVDRANLKQTLHRFMDRGQSLALVNLGH